LAKNVLGHEGGVLAFAKRGFGWGWRSNIREFLAGTNPTNAASVLKMWFTWTPFGKRLNWNAQRGLIYQVQVSNDLSEWANLGEANSLRYY